MTTEKEKSKFQQEVYELLAQVETATKEKLITVKQVEKLEIQVHDYSVKIEDLNRTIVDITSHKTRLSQENIELTKEVQDLKVNLENSTYLKSQLAGQLEDARRRLEDDERRRQTLEASLHQVEIELESVRVQLEEESEARLDLERQLVRANGDCQTWKSKYETEASARAEEVEELRRKFQARLSEQEEHIETLIVKVNALEKHKSRLQSEVEVLIIDLEKANTTARDLQKRVEHLEKVNIELKSRLEETVALYEQSQRDVRNKQTEIQRLTHELDKTREQKDALSRENKKLADDLHDARNQLTDMNRRLHELEIELRRLENEREELTAAYKEAEAGRKVEEQRCQRLSAEFSHFRHEMEKRITEKDEEIECIRPQGLLYEDNYRFATEHYKPVLDSLDKKSRIKSNSCKDLTDYGRDEGVRSIISKSNVKLTKSSKAISHQLLTESSVRQRIVAKVTMRKKLERKIRGGFSDDEGEEESVYQPHLEGLKRVKTLEFASRDALRNIQARAKAELSKNESSLTGVDMNLLLRQGKELVQAMTAHDERKHAICMDDRRRRLLEEEQCYRPLDDLKVQVKNFVNKVSNYYVHKSKQTSIEIEQLNARVVEAETKLKTEVTRIKKKLQIQITELEMSLDVANKNNIELQKTIKKQSISLTELQAHYDEVHRQLQVTVDQLGVSQRRIQSLTAELEEVRGNFESALRGKRTAEQMYEESQSRVNELTTINVNLSAIKTKIEQELATLASDYDEVTKELRVADERYQRVQVELKHTVEVLHEEQERVVKIESIKKSLEIEVKNLSVRLEEVEANAIVGGRRVISKLEARVRDMELELDEEKRRHAETIKILRKKERSVKEMMLQCEEDQKNVALLQESLDKATQKVNIYKRQLQEQEGMSQQSVTRVRRFQRELEAAEDRADTAESNLSLIRAKHRTFVTTSTVPGSQVYLVQETSRQTTTTETNY
ncbi:hypothetical protein J437_LFUL011622 [Ladona fulva]|uniref:Myosin tail domain-containing protein n=1 Tax=Ladona fulva TaxID=123851 RepID=A0A8K0KBX8_LADFU|nr:hypothetical protein J437_LFUL011622 [Ladona fulva]